MQEQHQMSLTLDQATGDHLKGFLYMWLKDVKGFDSSQHCAGCLIGTYNKEVGKNMPNHHEIVLPDLQAGHVYYLCGVATPYVWSKNFHLAFVKGDWEVEMPLWTGAVFKLKGIRPIHFDDRAAKEAYPDKGKEFLTCRNFQFGAEIFPKGNKITHKQGLK